MPSELLDYVTREACRIHYWEGEGKQEDAFTLTNLCLVCHHWAVICRPQLWERVFITSATRLHGFCALLDLPQPSSLQPIASFVVVCYLTPTFGCQGDPPWLHRAHKNLSIRLPKTTQFNVRIQHSDITSATLHPYLPYTLPATHLPIVHLELIDIQLESRSALLKLLSSNPLLEYVLCSHVKWTTEEPPSPSLVLNSRLRDITMEETSADAVWWLLPPLVGHRTRPKNRAINGSQTLRALRQVDVEAVVAMICSMQSNLRLLTATLARYDCSTRTDCPYIFMEFDYESFPGDSASSSQKYFSAEVHYAERQETKLRADGDGFLLPRWYTVQYIYIHIRDDEAYWDKHWTLDIWSSFGRHALGLSDLQRLLFCFSGHRQMRDFVVRYGPAFCIEGLRSKLRFGHGKCWARHPSVVQQISTDTARIAKSESPFYL
ncbi:hypothetical protein PHLGIDRAFT_126992 [Phlebiopsis gigantea 11061_1 CR5-6]|uniref:F-box domain-containing protein n=1 Tax=Phlebiopsis gigantea (strain 11061_1 CR5-6) TaxID=745531 RepID=A0A0C3S9P3_PHLG1|nr:hypothetical protein PHLGIDRAFT_126992 [Phlebiopsis gigantea 11061_1 CR5-6]